MTLEPAELGERIGELIVALVDLVADIDGTTRDQVLEQLFAEWWRERISR